MNHRFTYTEALKYLANCVSEAIDCDECDIRIFTGGDIERDGKPCPYEGNKLAQALQTIGYERAAERVHKECKLPE